MRRRKKPEKATKKEPWLDGPKALVISTVITASVELIKHPTLSLNSPPTLLNPLVHLDFPTIF
ncbi:hypothetical protein, partial [Streptococcus pseudopneumoniae]|uniref:hypothetical protein n=1 Tax=Streptococcus pseudopneumoniae TaxID=257758 RepID=UPI000A50FBB2